MARIATSGYFSRITFSFSLASALDSGIAKMAHS
jgi:hypothetical protein